MYSVRAVVNVVHTDGTTTKEEILIHDNKSPLNELHLIDPKLKMADASAGTFTATMTPSNPGYDLIERFTSTIKVYKENKLIWTGRVLSESIDFWNRKTINCEGALAYLNDTIQPIAYYGSGKSPQYVVETLLGIHNAKVSIDRKLYLGSIDHLVEFTGPDYVFQTDNGTTWAELKYNIFDRYKCHLEVEYINDLPYINIYHTHANTASQRINFGENLLNFTRDRNLIDIATVILPRGAKLDEDTPEGQQSYITLKTSNEDCTPIANGPYSIGSYTNIITVSGQYIINNELYSKNGRVEQVVDFNDATTPQELFRCAQGYLLGMQFDELVLKVNAVDLHALTHEVVSFNLLDRVYCVSVPHGMYGQYFPIAEIEIPLSKPENTTYTMTRTATRTYGLTGSLTDFKSNIGSSFKNLTTSGHILDLAKINATSIINRKTTGYVSVINMFDSNEEGVAQAIVIADNPEWKKASKYWIWNMNGLAYYNGTRSSEIAQSVVTNDSGVILPNYTEQDGYNFSQPRYYDMAITMDGTIVANHIKAGILSDGMGYNYWNLETGEFLLQPNTKFQYGTGEGQYQTVYDLIWRTDEAYNKRTGATNYLNGTKDWAEWRWGGSWAKEENDEEVMTCQSKGTVSWNDVLMSPTHNIEYAAIKGYTMTFSIEGCMSGSYDSEWGEITSTNAVVISFSLISSSGTRIARMDKLFSFDSDWSRRFVSVDMLDASFVQESGASSYDNMYLDIWIYNRSIHGVHVRRPQFERGNTPTDWGMSEADVDKEAKNKADEAEKSAKQFAEYEANSAASAAYEKAAGDISDLNTRVIETYIPAIGDDLKSFTKDEVTAINNSLNQEEIMDRLTGARYGRNTPVFYMKDNELLINATYIRSGTLDAGLLKAGIIYAGRDSVERNNNYWDLTRGILKTENSIFTNAEITGSLESVSEDDGTSIRIGDGMIRGYASGGTSTIVPTIFNQQQRSGSWRRTSGLVMQSTGSMVIACDDLRVGFPRGSHGDMSYETEQETCVYIKYVTNVYVDGDGNVNCNMEALDMRFIHGILTYWKIEGIQ